MKNENVITMKVNIRDEQIDCWLCGAFEGGSNYWCDGIRVKDNDYKGVKYASDCVSKGGALIVEDKEIDKQCILNALEKMPSLNYSKAQKRLLDDSYDSGDCDILFQIAVFGDVIYG